MRRNNLGINPDISQFTVRATGLKLWQLLLITFIALDLVICTVYFGDENLMLATFVFLSVCNLLFIHLSQKRSMETRTMSEFQALVFSGAMRANTVLTLVVSHNYSIFYLDPRYTHNFAKAKAGHNLDEILSIIQIPEKDKSKVFDAIASNQFTIIYFTFSDDHSAQSLRLRISPLVRPAGYFSLVVEHVH